MPREVFCRGYTRSVAIADVNNDGLNDVIVANESKGIECSCKAARAHWRNERLPRPTR